MTTESLALQTTEQQRSITPPALLAMAVQQGADLEKLERLMALQERWEANEARRAFNKAFSAFKDEAVKIIKNETVKDGPLKGKKYAQLFAVVEAVTPALSQHGLSASWRITKDERDWIEVTCTVKHIDGHFESVSMGGPPDTGGAKNAIQARASAVTYLERYTLKAICGLSEQEDDTDGGGGGGSGDDIGALTSRLISEMKKRDTDEAALAFWHANKAQLGKHPNAYREFKDETSAHRRALSSQSTGAAA